MDYLYFFITFAVLLYVLNSNNLLKMLEMDFRELNSSLKFYCLQEF